MFNFLRQKAINALGGGVIRSHTILTARKKELDGNGVYQYTDERRVVKDKVVTTAFVDFIVDQLIAETSVFGDFKYHEVGIGVGAENITDTALGTTSGIDREAGTQVETDHDTYKSVATITADATEAWTEHGLFNVDTAGTLMDRTVFGEINVVSSNQVEFTFEISFAAGS